MVQYQQVASNDTTPQDYCTMLGPDMVQILVGSTKRPFIIHKGILSTKIPYFNAMFNSGFVEGQTSKAELPEEDPDAMNLVFQWVYTGRFEPANAENSSTWEAAAHNRIHAYIFAEKACCDQLLNYAVSSIISCYIKADTFPCVSCMKLAYTNTRDDSGLRVFMCRSLLFVIQHEQDTGKWNVNKLAELCTDNFELLRDTFAEMRSLGNSPVFDPKKVLVKCLFHNHSKLSECELNNNEVD